ncbi:MAG: HEAT repeat domain-containing protein [Bacteroidota bacterium]
MKQNLPLLLLFSLSLLLSCQEKKAKELEATKPEIITLEPERAATLAQKIRKEVAAELADGLELSLWASDTLVHDPVSISIAPDGRIFYTSAHRQTHSEFDIRGHRDWMTASISFQSIEDRRKFLRETFTDDSEASQKYLEDLNEDGVLNWKDLTVEKEEIWFVEDASGDGVADRTQLFLRDFDEEISDLANGVEFHDGDVYVTCAPDLWKATDTDNDGVSDEVMSLARGFAIHIGFGAHGLSGPKFGPDGRIWWGIGDIGANVTDQDGKQWKYPNQGVIARCEPDGSNFEIYSAGLRNTHEFTFDKYGNLITEDNDGDHQGERERLVYLINGSDCGWRINWQFGKYTDPDNNDYKVWMDEGLHIPRWEEQAAYILPPIINYVNGPTGFVYNPGTALGEEWNDHFFVAEFRGTPANSPIHAFTLKPDGAGFALDQTQIIAKGMLPTGLDFGADGALYFGDWIEGWNPQQNGRIWKLDVEEGKNSEIRQQTKQLIQADFAAKEIAELSDLLAHQDMRVRQKAQFELVKRGEEGYEALFNTAMKSDNQLARIHGIWGIGQLSQRDEKYAWSLSRFVRDEDPEIIAQAVRIMGDIRDKSAAKLLRSLNLNLIAHESPRVRLMVTEALGRLGEGMPQIMQMIIDNDDDDMWLRHAGMIALSRVGSGARLAALKNHDSRALRMAAVVALRRMQSLEIAAFLQDPDELIVTEAARGINDDFSIEGAFPALANLLNNPRFTNEALLRRAINVNLRMGKEENMNNLLNFIQRPSAPPDMKAEALAALSTWAKPSVLDRVDGRYRGEVTREAAPVKAALQTMIEPLLKSNQSAMQIAATKAAAKFELTNTAPTLFALVKNAKTEVKQAALQALTDLKSEQLNDALEVALSDKDSEVRALALEIVPESGLEEEKSVALFEKILDNGTVKEQQSALTALGTLKGESATTLLGVMLTKLRRNAIPLAIHLDLIEAIENQGNTDLLEQLKLYQTSKPKDNPIAAYQEALAGGTAWKGRDIFYRNEAAQCVRCHAVFEHGGNAGPGLAGVGDRLSNEKILESLVAPSATYALGYEVVILEMKDGESLSGIVQKEDDATLTIGVGQNETQNISKTNITNRQSVPSSMPNMSTLLSKHEIRDVVAFLGSLKEES